MYKFVLFEDSLDDMMSKLDVGGACAHRSVSSTTVAHVGVGVEIHNEGSYWLVIDNGVVVAHVNKAHIRNKVERIYEALPEKVG